MTRKLVTVRKIKDLQPIPDADAIMVATVDDWQLVVKTTEFKVGDLCVYFEIDSHLPIRPEYEFLRARCFKRMGDREGFRLKTIKLRGQISQGLALPLDSFVEQFYGSKYDEGQELGEFFYVGKDLTEFTGVEKYEAPVPVELAGQVEGKFPAFVVKTDQERCQNMGFDIFQRNIGARYEVSIKLDGTSFTSYFNNGETGVCSRNWELKLNEENVNNSLIKMFVESGLRDSLLYLNENIAVQGELMGPGIAHNREKLPTTKLFVFDVFDINTFSYVGVDKRMELLDKLYFYGLNRNMVGHVPILHKDISLEELQISNVPGLLAYAEGPSITHLIREGLVFKRKDGKFSFKAIANNFLLQEK